ncbi:MAG: PKD domain-containing protein [Candidatus Magasanikbacteria bacterium]|jgi:hypothetical protein|nr:PKD domain-containing protein [Candidatus Magasanikbacteria bacterium]MBT4315212.1 PKD domain-containing protein [Candidatus Magasanikbacteria bacterium]MBT4547252.1 PKD domain-containing protein [Candidatus Magasanikbacteria bacterium]MBT6819019.1 PKD domain-containing protein [Candidatus Magasanikbacteria bacterium]
MKNFKPTILFVVFVMAIFLFFNSVRSENSDIVINEICSTGCASSGHQWIEIYNKGTVATDVTGWKFYEDETNHSLSLASSSTEQDFIIQSGEYALIVQNDLYFFEDNPDVTSTVFDSSWGTLNKSGEEIALKNSAGDLTEQFTYQAISNFSLERKDSAELITDENNWQEHVSSHTAGQPNYWNTEDTEENQIPTAVIAGSSTAYIDQEAMFDASDSSDLDGIISSYEWLLDGVSVGGSGILNYIFTTTGTFNLILNIEDDDGAFASTSLGVLVESEKEEEPEAVATTTSGLIINEFVSDPVSGENEWIEIYNPTTSSIDLTGWKLYDGMGSIASPTSTIEAGGFFVIELSSSKLNNSGDIIILKNDLDEIVDSVSYGDWDDGDTSDNALAVSDPNSIARIINGQNTGNNKNDFAETTTVTKGASNQIAAPVVSVPSSGGGGGGTVEPAPTVTYSRSEVVINEIVSDPTDGAVEFVELYNRTASSVDLAGWWIEDGGESKTNLNGNISVRSFKTIESPKGNLNNSGDSIVLFAPDGTKIDQVTYGTWDDGNISDNAPAPDDPLSLIRKIDGQDGNNDYYDFVLTSTITPGSSNIVSVVTEGGEVVEQLLTSAQIKINEIMPNPVGSDNEDEFIELKNEGSETINLKNWFLSDSTSKKYKITQGSIKSGDFIVFKRSMTGIALNNTGGDEVKLYSTNSSLVDSVKYAGRAGESETYARKDDGTWAWTIKTTSGKANIIEGVSAAPIISIDVDTEVAQGESVIFDASDTTDPEAEEMSFEWDFGDGTNDEGIVVEHIFNNEGVYGVKLKATDGSGNVSEKQVIITVKNVLDFVGGYFESGNISKIKISEFIPNPEGSDTTEFIELYNSGDEEIDLSGIKIDDEEGGSRAYTFPNGTIIQPGEYFIVGRQDSKLALNNTSDSVRLLYPDGTILQEVRYDDVLEGASYIADENEKWLWTSAVTAGKENIISSVALLAKTKTVSRAKSKMIKPIINTTLEKLRDEDIGDKVKVVGIVAVEPGVLGSQYFYIVGSPGVQVYMYKKDFPDLKVGDRVEVTGEISEAYGETRIKLVDRGDIKVIDHQASPVPKSVEIADLQEPYEGWLVQVSGEITELKSSYMYVDDGTEEIKVYFKRGAGINKKILQAGDLVKVSGLLAQTKTGYQILPRSQEDIKKTGVAESFVTKIENEEGEEKKETVEKYLTATAGGLTSILVGLFAKARGAGVVGFARRMTGVAVAVVKRRKG